LRMACPTWTVSPCFMSSSVMVLPGRQIMIYVLWGCLPIHLFEGWYCHRVAHRIGLSSSAAGWGWQAFWVGYPGTRLLLKRLHWAILRALPLPFLAAFGTLMFLLLMQFLIKWLPQLVGRGLPFGAMAELVTYSLAYMVTLAVPMAWLIAQLAAFGRLAESRAYLVVKSAGVPLWRLAWPTLIVGAGLVGALGYFNNVMLPLSVSMNSHLVTLRGSFLHSRLKLSVR